MIDKLIGAILGFGAASMFSKKGGTSFAKGGNVANSKYEWVESAKIVWPSSRKEAEKRLEKAKLDFPAGRNFRIIEVPYSWGIDYRILFEYERRKMAQGGSINDLDDPFKYYIEFWNKDKGFKIDRVYFDSIEVAKDWGRETLENFHPDMVRMERKMEQGGLVPDLFSEYEKQPENIRKIVEKYGAIYEEEGFTYDILARMTEELEQQGYTMGYGLDAEPYGLRPIGVPLNQVEGFEDLDDDEFEKGGTTASVDIQEVIERINSSYEGVVAAQTYTGNRIQVVSPFFNTLNEIKRKEFSKNAIMERYGNTGSYVLYSNKPYFAKGGLLKRYKDLKMGADIEMGHKETIRKFKKEGMSDREVAMMIAKDHLKEDFDYYKKMKSIENE